jgi:predicted membrane metal-binding protein
MRWAGWPLTITIIAVSLAISYILFQFGIFFFFLPIIFLPFLRFIKRKSPTPYKVLSCPNCGLQSYGNFCPQCGTKMVS